jgi:hypothetical protein
LFCNITLFMVLTMAAGFDINSLSIIGFSAVFSSAVTGICLFSLSILLYLIRKYLR